MNATLACPASRQQLLSIACIIQSQVYDAACAPKMDKIDHYKDFVLSPNEDAAITSMYEKIEEFEFDVGKSISEVEPNSTNMCIYTFTYIVIHMCILIRILSTSS